MKGNSRVVSLLKSVGAIITDSHIVGTSGRHMSVYINKDALFPHTRETSTIGNLFATKYVEREIDVVVGPAMGGIILSQWTAYHLTRKTKREVYGVYTDKTETGDQIFKRGYDAFVRGKRVLVIEDLTTTGGSIQKVIHAVHLAGGTVVEACVMVNRDPKRVNEETLGVPFSWLGVFPAESYAADDCPLCKADVPINTAVGHGRKFLEQKGLV